MRIGLFIVALAVRIAAIEATGAAAIRFGDAADYVATARSICTAQAYPERGNLPFFRPPGIPFFLAGVTLCDPSQVRVMKYALAAVDAGTVVLIFELGGLLAGAAAAFYPFFIFSTTDVRSEPLFMFLLTLGILLLVRGRPAGAGVATALAALTRPTALLCLPLFALFGVRRRQSPLSFLIAATLTLMPWVMRNYLRFGELILVNDAGSYSVWHASTAETRKIYATNDPGEFQRLEWEFETKKVHEVAAQVAARATTPNGRDREWRRLAIEEWRKAPAASLRFAAKKAWYYWRPWLNPIEHGRLAVIASACILIPLYVLAAIGLRRHPYRNAVLIYFAVLWLAHIPHQVVMRYRIPFTDPLLLVFALRKRDADADSQSRSASPTPA